MLFAMVPIGKRCILLQAITIIVIAMNNNLTLDPGQFFFGYQLREQSNHNDIFTHQLQYFFLELPRLRKKWEKLETNAERWCYLFGNLNNSAKIPQNTAGFDDVFALAQTGETR